MKKLILGISIFATGMLCTAIVTAGVVANAIDAGVVCSFVVLLLQYDLSPVMTAYLCLSIVGFILALVGIFEKDEVNSLITAPNT